MNKNKFLSFVVSIMMILSLFGVQTVKAEQILSERKEIKIFHTNDTHSRVDNFSKLQAYIKNYNGEYLLLDMGDTFHGQSFATLENGSSVAKILNMMKYDAMSPGNHDFNYGQDRLKELSEEANVPVLALNVKKDNKANYEETLIKEINGVKVGLLGIASPETAYKTNPANVIGLDFGSNESIIKDTQTAVNDLKAKGAQVIVALSHLGIDEATELKATDLGSAVSGIDVILDGHSHSKIEDYEKFNNENDTKIISAGEYLKYFGETTIILNDKNEVVDVELKMVDSEELTLKDENVEKLINDIKLSQESILNTVVGKTPIDLDGARESVRNGHTNLGRLLTSSMLDATDADIAITNGGGIRDSIKLGNITKGDVIKVLPFGNYVVTKKVLGSDIIKALEHGMVQGAGSFSHFAGMEVVVEKYNTEDGKIKNKVKSVKVNGKNLDVKKEYVMATNDFMAVGGDGYTMFKDYPTLNEYSGLDEILTNYIAKIGENGILVIDKEERLIEFKEEPATSLEGIYSQAYKATIAVRDASSTLTNFEKQSLINNARIAIKSLSKFASHINSVRTFSPIVDKVQHPILVDIVNSINFAEKNITQSNINTARKEIVTNLPNNNNWLSTYSQALDNVQIKFTNKVIGAVKLAYNDKTESNINSAKILAEELKTSVSKTISNLGQELLDIVNKF